MTDIVARAVADGVAVVSAQPDAMWETLGVNSKVQLAELERSHQRNLANPLLEQGVTLVDPARIDIRGSLVCGRDVTIDVGCVFEGEVTLADGVTVGANCVLRNARIAAGAAIKPFCHIEDAVIGAKSMIGPYARLRPGTELGEDVHIGNFVEVKNSQIAAHSKANHLAYVGDATVGSRVNIGAGTITCNYDGVNKFRTVIEDDVFIGSDMPAGGAGDGRPRRDAGRRHDADARCAGRQADRVAPEANHDRRLETAHQTTQIGSPPCAASSARLRSVISFPSCSKA